MYMLYRYIYICVFFPPEKHKPWMHGLVHTYRLHQCPQYHSKSQEIYGFVVVSVIQIIPLQV